MIDLGEASSRECRQALEALRNGVPNRHAVRLLGSNQPDAEGRFTKMLEAAANRHGGMLVSGDFGTGKSHLLAHFQELAVHENFVCSKVAISKETPLYDLGKVFAAAVDSACIPGRSGRMIEELVHVLVDLNRQDGFLQWCKDAADHGLLNQIFPATALVHQRLGSDPSIANKIEAFWSGDKIRVTDVRRPLREINEDRNFRFQAPRVAELPPQRLRFVLQLIRGAGYRGWVVLLDELELLGSYSILQRGRSYAEVAKWLGLGKMDASVHPGIVAVGTLTEDFASAVISADGKQDLDNIAPRLRANPRHAHLASDALRGMRSLSGECLALRPPAEDEIAGTIESLRAIYEKAYDWSPPPADVAFGGAGHEGRMRYKVRSAIHQWDIARLVPDATPDIRIDPFTASYDEDADLEGDPTP